MEKIGIDVATAALDQPGGEGSAYGRGTGNWQRLTRFERRAPCSQDSLSQRKAGPMTFSPLKRSGPFALAPAAGRVRFATLERLLNGLHCSGRRGAYRYYTIGIVGFFKCACGYCAALEVLPQSAYILVSTHHM